MNRIKIKMVVAMAGLGIATIGQPAMAVSVIGEVLRGSGTAAIAVAGVAAADSSAYDSMILHSSFHISSWRIGGTTAAGNALDPVAPGTAANAAVAPGRADRSDPSPRIEAQYRTEASAGTAARGGIATSAGIAGPAEIVAPAAAEPAPGLKPALRAALAPEIEPRFPARPGPGTGPMVRNGLTDNGFRTGPDAKTLAAILAPALPGALETTDRHAGGAATRFGESGKAAVAGPFEYLSPEPDAGVVLRAGPPAAFAAAMVLVDDGTGQAIMQVVDNIVGILKGPASLFVLSISLFLGCLIRRRR